MFLLCWNGEIKRPKYLLWKYIEEVKGSAINRQTCLVSGFSVNLVPLKLSTTMWRWELCKLGLLWHVFDMQPKMVGSYCFICNMFRSFSYFFLNWMHSGLLVWILVIFEVILHPSKGACRRSPQITYDLLQQANENIYKSAYFMHGQD